MEEISVVQQLLSYSHSTFPLSLLNDLLIHTKNCVQMADELIQQILGTCESHYESCELIKSEASQLPKVKEMIDEATTLAVSLKGKLTELEKMIDEFAKGNEARSFERWKQNQINAFDRYVDLKNEELEEKRKLYNQHYEEFMFNNKAQKVQLYQANFEMQMENYRKRTMNPPLYNNEHTMSLSDDDVIAKLEQVEIETADDRDALENFLESSSDVEYGVDSRIK
ncbi:4827_t:CDS:2 [Acaulospora colombiana]|uniref:4827_t:CDS:1 n=1 Tax=Acaulospora colombiana TaxID=27376 RepID=A0ACA9KU28_9GLOM|nr:4827_t:CDS:2 [Acaulospora colombiana]